MTKTLFRTLAILAAWALFAPLSMVQAQDVQLASHAELNDLYARLAELESRIAATNVSGGCGCADAVGCGNGCNDGCCNDCCSSAGWVGGAEILWLKAFNSSLNFGDFNYDAGFRWWLGYQGDSGLGVRMRGFDYSQNAANGDFVDIQTFDVEVYDSFQLGCNWDVILGAGLRYTDTAVAPFGGGEVTTDFQIFGTGPVVTAELYRHVSDRAALYAIVRESIVAGDGNVGLNTVTDDTLMISEIQLGGQVHREYNGGLLLARLGWEAQYYADVPDIVESTTLMGVNLSAGLMR